MHYHTRTALSPLPDTIFCPSGLNDADITISECSWNPRETKLAVKFKMMVAPDSVATDETEGELDACDRDTLPPNLRMTACPVACLFQDGARYECNSTVIENQPAYYDAAMVNLYTKFDSTSDTSGSCALISRRKDMRDEIDMDPDDDARSGFAQRSVASPLLTQIQIATLKSGLE